MVIEIDARALVVALNDGRARVVVLTDVRVLVVVLSDGRVLAVVLTDVRVLVEVPDGRMEVHVEITAGALIVIRKKSRSVKIATAPKLDGKLLQSMMTAKPPCGKLKTIRSDAAKKLKD